MRSERERPIKGPAGKLGSCARSVARRDERVLVSVLVSCGWSSLLLVVVVSGVVGEKELTVVDTVVAGESD